MSQASPVVQDLSRVSPPRFVRSVPAPVSAVHRIVNAVVFVISVGVLLTAYALAPSASGMGTHRQLGLPPCGFVSVTGIPCATCGMTTAFSHAAHGHLWTSFVTQPAGAILAIFTAAATLISGYALVLGISLAPLGGWLWRPSKVWAIGGLIIAAWLYKIIITLWVA